MTEAIPFFKKEYYFLIPQPEWLGDFLCCILICLCCYGQQGVVHIFSKDAVSAGRVVDKNMGHTMIPMETYQDCIEYYTICEENTQNKKTENQAKRCFDDAEDIRKESI